MTQQRLAKPPDDPADFQASLLRQQNDLLYKNLPSSILGTLIVAVSAAAFFWQTVQQQRLLIWLAAVIGVGLARTLILWSYRTPVSYTHLTLPTIILPCRSRWSPYH